MDAGALWGLTCSVTGLAASCGRLSSVSKLAVRIGRVSGTA
jgi:hypothetical protein